LKNWAESSGQGHCLVVSMNALQLKSMYVQL